MTKWILLTAAFLVSCKSNQRLPSSIHPKYVGKIFMQHANNLHVRDEVNLQPEKDAILFLYRPKTNLRGNAYIMTGEYIGNAKVVGTGDGKYFSIQLDSGVPKVGDVLFDERLSQNDIPLVYKGTILECSKPNQIHIYGTAKDGLKPELELDVYRYQAVSDFTETNYRMEKTKVGQVKVMRDGGSNFAIVQKVSGDIKVNDLVELGDLPK